jgi:hypothetical protein
VHNGFEKRFASSVLRQEPIERFFDNPRNPDLLPYLDVSLEQQRPASCMQASTLRAVRSKSLEPRSLEVKSGINLAGRGPNLGAVTFDPSSIRKCRAPRRGSEIFAPCSKMGTAVSPIDASWPHRWAQFLNVIGQSRKKKLNISLKV